MGLGIPGMQELGVGVQASSSQAEISARDCHKYSGVKLG